MSVRYAGFWIRLLAHIIDSIILNGITLLCEAALLRVGYWGWRSFEQSRGNTVPAFEDAFNPLALQLFSGGLYLVFAFPYFVWAHYRWGTTLGKRPFSIYVVQDETLEPITINQSIGRFFAYLASYLTLFAGFIMAAFQPKKRALHDVMAGTVSIRKTAALLFVALFCGSGALATPAAASQELTISKLGELSVASSVSEEDLQVEPVSSVARTSLQLVASWMTNSGEEFGGDLGAALLFQPWSNHWAVMGPRLGYSTGDVYAGVEGVLWVANALGPGLAADGGEAFWRVEPFFTARAKRFSRTGAWAFRTGPLYHSEFGWGFRAGLALQLGGVEP